MLHMNRSGMYSLLNIPYRTAFLNHVSYTIVLRLLRDNERKKHVYTFRAQN